MAHAASFAQGSSAPSVTSRTASPASSAPEQASLLLVLSAPAMLALTLVVVAVLARMSF